MDTKTFFVIGAVIGLLDPACTLEMMCTPNYTASVRPASSYTTKLKRKQLDAMGLYRAELASYEEDHIVPLVLCGHPTDPRNLMPERWDRARQKDVLESRYHRAVCKGQMTLEQAQKQIVAYE